MSRAFDRRTFVSGSLAALVVLPASGLVRAQARVVREGWSGTGEPTGREPVDVEALTDEERAHVPVLTLPRHVHLGRPFDLVVQVGLRPHAMTSEHHIDWIEVCLDERRVAVVDLSTDVSFPIVRLPIALPAPAVLTARAHCNQHGTWRTRRDLAPG
ncbi:MAG: desulfoferrodoxin family protein [Sandaracinus sp.]